MRIWKQEMSLELVNQRSKGTMMDFLGIEFVEFGDDFLTATMPVHERTIQPMGILHGGASVVLAETVASTAANMAVDFSKYYCVGLEINANHLRSASQGLITAITRPIHLGRSTQVWSIELFNELQQPTCISRMTASVLTRQ